MEEERRRGEEERVGKRTREEGRRGERGGRRESGKEVCVQRKNIILADLLTNECTHTHTHTTFLLFLSSHVQKGDILLSINGISLVGRTHQEAIQTIKSMTPAATIRMELIQVSTHSRVDGGWLRSVVSTRPYTYMWQTRIEIECYSLVYFERITKFNAL